MRPIPVAFHIWFLEVHTYGIGLAASNAARFGLEHLEKAFLACRDANRKLLSGHGYEQTILTELIVRIVAKPSRQ